MLDKQSAVPYYLQIYTELKERIADGIYKTNALMPSENELVNEYNVTRLTIRNALKKLKDDGLIYTEKGKGSFVNSQKIEQSLFRFYSFGRRFPSDTEVDSKSVVLQASVVSGNNEVCRNLKLETGSKVNEIIRIRKLDSTPVIVETSYIPLSIAPDILSFNLEESSIYDLLEYNYKMKILRAKEYLDPNISDAYFSKLLGIETGTPIFVTERTTYTTSDYPIEFRISIIRSDKFRFSVELR